MKTTLLCSQLVLGMVMAGRCESPSWAEIENLLSKSMASKEVANFVEKNHLNGRSVTNASAVVTAFLNFKESPLALVCDNGVVDEVDIALWKYDFIEALPYSGKLPHGLQQKDTFDTVVQRLGQPTRQAFHHGTIDAYFQKLRLAFTFDGKSRQLRDILIYNEGFGPQSRLLQ